MLKLPVVGGALVGPAVGFGPPVGAAVGACVGDVPSPATNIDLLIPHILIR